MEGERPLPNEVLQEQLDQRAERIFSRVIIGRAPLNHAQPLFTTVMGALDGLEADGWEGPKNSSGQRLPVPVLKQRIIKTFDDSVQQLRDFVQAHGNEPIGHKMQAAVDRIAANNGITRNLRLRESAVQFISLSMWLLKDDPNPRNPLIQDAGRNVVHGGK